MKNIYINTCITMNFCILFVIFHKLSKYGKFYYILIEQQWKCSCSNNKVYTNTVLIQNIYTHTFSRSRYMYGIYSEESRQKSERENLAHLGTIRISFKDSWHHQVWLRKKAIKDANLHPVIFPLEKPPTITLISFKLLLIKNLLLGKG